MGAEAYHEAILNYLERCQYATATDDILFEEIQKVIDAEEILIIIIYIIAKFIEFRINIEYFN